MSPSLRHPAALLLALPLLAPNACTSRAGRDGADLGSFVASIKAIDSHAHPMRYVAPGAAADTEYDALPLDGIPPFQVPWRLRLDNPEWRQAQQALFGVAPSDTGRARHDALVKARERAVREHGARYPEWVLDQAGIDVMLANRIAMGEGLAAPRFRWVAFADPLMLPLDSRNEAVRTPDTKPLYPKEAKLLQRYVRDLGLSALPPTLDAYVERVVKATLRRQKDGGAVATKFEAAYLRPLDFDDADEGAARRIYAQFVRSGAPDREQYKTLEDYLFRVICGEAGRLGMAVQIHVLEGFGGYYSPRGSAPQLLEPALSDTSLRATTFVIVHGGWPLVDQTQALLARPNVYADISAMVLTLEPARLAQVLRQWLAEWPEQVLFGTDAFDGGADQGWADVAWLGASTGRRALSEALNGMVNSGEIDKSRAQALARMVLRENAARAYRLAGR